MKDLNRHFFKKDTHRANKHTLVIRETQIKTTVKYHFTPIRMATIKKTRKKQVLARM